MLPERKAIARNLAAVRIMITEYLSSDALVTAAEKALAVPEKFGN